VLCYVLYLDTVSPKKTGALTDLHIDNLDAVPPIYVVSNHLDTDKLTTANGRKVTSSSAGLGNQSR